MLRINKQMNNYKNHMHDSITCADVIMLKEQRNIYISIDFIRYAKGGKYKKMPCIISIIITIFIYFHLFHGINIQIKKNNY